MGELSECLSTIDCADKSAGGGMNTVLEDPEMEEEYAKSYINGYAALVWNEDGTSARGLVPVRYYSESDSSSPRESKEEGEEASSSEAPLGREKDEVAASQREGRGALARQKEPGMVSTKTLRRLDERAERVKALWERQGFSTYWDLRWTPDGGQKKAQEEEEEEEEEEEGEEAEQVKAEDRQSFQSVAYSWREVSKKDGDRSPLDASERRGPCSIYSLQGRRPTMEDAFASFPCSGRTDMALMAGKWRLFGMFDGHGGTRCSHFCRDELLTNVASFIPAGDASCDQVCEALIEGFLYSDRKFLLHAERFDWIDGSTAIVVALSSSEIIVANAGDCRAVLGVVRSSGDAGELIVDSIAMSRDHRLDDEEEVSRVQSMGGFVLHRYGSGIPRVMGVLAVSRALGDASLKPYVTAEPDISLIARADEQWFIVLATDGLWDVFSNEEAVSFILAHMIEGAPDCGARALAHAAFKRGSTDNISVMIIDLRGGRG
ncbi:hypothetical protein GUITHDRAFT_118383 [Guillardia theta CCMP2712]|uniref:PPM-type phosphatase domain-containing protein n=1 Tax=Guillardia theta (strain CCMP2712) TaxID=905079 RepID=L1IHA0_GUITC|nr:hypothetical protein GUITHDRAFT_118383 [Guillardia theta CCMP2712]EKX35467.1 hypothetical protein GUITHDRAFT_118383 [Guillardia theta CCMP2712]|eukprot:XP_005822447.1 hypothetical protein GUITHDRAFT_118383 [Guillardia theta CCMP2712]